MITIMSRVQCIHPTNSFVDERYVMFARPADWHLHRYRQLGNLAPLPRYYQLKAAMENSERLQKQLTADDYDNSHHN